ncbi:MAG TPA: DUF2231 domain-containing protein [Sphingomicrobium sp.]|nr:DUF2231 domain-containing protein [Sphingomicrobium sp.]
MAKAGFNRRGGALHPVHVVLLAGTLPLFLGAMLSDWGYSQSYQIQWVNFASWLIAGGLVFAALALLWALIDLLRAARSGQPYWLYAGLLLALFVVGIVNALVHARDGWGTMPAGLILSVVSLALAMAAIWAAHVPRRFGEDR